ncbi:hypothetical protein [Paracoccus ravus]|uniref:hypothetical protein n=1 Tax=Paracoccus ravus TaxID=2447760 RepID=UPI00106ED127|nr:hypothetical protein [Paracoccus ravus]
MSRYLGYERVRMILGLSKSEMARLVRNKALDLRCSHEAAFLVIRMAALSGAAVGSRQAGFDFDAARDEEGRD